MTKQLAQHSIDAYRTAHPDEAAAEDDNVVQEIADLNEEFEAAAHGFRSYEFVLTSISMDRWVSPLLHMKLGLTHYILLRIFAYVLQHLGHLDPHIVEEKARLETFRLGLVGIIADRNALPKPYPAAVVAAVKRANDEYKKRVKALNKMIKERANKPMEKAIGKVLAEYNIVMQAFHSNALIGEHAHRLLLHHNVIILRISEIMKNRALRRAEATVTATDDDIDLFLQNILRVMEVLHSICSMMTQVEALSEEQCEEFATLCQYFGHRWRIAFPGRHVPIKVHILETHVPEQMTEWRILGLMAEDPIERLHHIENLHNRQFACIRSWKDKQVAIQTRTSKDTHPAVAAAALEALSGTKRSLRDETLAAKEEKLAELEAAKVPQHNSLLDRIRLFNLQHNIAN